MVSVTELFGVIREKFWPARQPYFGLRSDLITKRTVPVQIANSWLSIFKTILEDISNKASLIASNQLSLEQVENWKTNIIAEITDSLDWPDKIFKNNEGLIEVILPRLSLPDEVDTFRNKLLKLGLDLEEKLEPKFEQLAKETEKDNITNLAYAIRNELIDFNLKLSSHIARENKDIERVAKLTSLEIQATISQTRIAAALSVITTILGAFLLYWFGPHKTEESTWHDGRQELVSEYKIRLTETEADASFLSAINKTNVLFSQKQQHLLQIIDGGEGYTNELRSTLSWERLIRDLQVKYDVDDGADKAAVFVLNLKDAIASNPQDKTNAINEYIDELSKFSKKIDESNLSWWQKISFSCDCDIPPEPSKTNQIVQTNRL